MENLTDKIQAKRIKNGLSTIRIRTWSLTLVIIATLALYLLVTVSLNAKFNWVDFALNTTLQIVVFNLYFPDGDLFGQKDESFIANRMAYNLKAERINQEHKQARLREFCKFEVEERRKRYIANECGYIGIDVSVYEELKKLSSKEIKSLESYKFIENGEEKTIVFGRGKRRRLYKLLFDELPVQENHPETIMSAVENDGTKAIKDGSVSFRKGAYARKFFNAIVIGGFFAYVGIKARDGIGLPQIVSIAMYLTTMLTSGTMAFSTGENCSKVHKNLFYIELVNFIDKFEEWDKK